MSGGPQVFLGTTTFYLISGCRQISGHREACPPARLGDRAALGASSRSPARPRRPRGNLQSGGAGHGTARPRRPRGGLQSGGAGHDPTGPRRRPRAAQPGPAGLAAASNRAAQLLSNVARNSLERLSNIEVSTLELQRFERGSKTDRCKLRATFARGYVVAAAHRQRDPAQRDPARRLNCAPKLGRV